MSSKPAGFRTHMLVAGAAALFIGLADVLAARFANCRIPDDYISVSRLPLFSAREVLRGLVEDLKTCSVGELPA
ncbi:MAG: hypothetical protein ACR2KU_01725 [Gammaproteobacteria bacterium]